MTTATRELADLQAEIDAARTLLLSLQRESLEAESDLRSRQAASLLEANEQLVLGMLRAQTDAETAARDIAFRELTTELRLEAQRLGEENRQISETSRLKSQFLANMSHELRTPLTAIIGISDLLRSRLITEASPRYLECLGHIDTSAKHLLEIINGVLDLAKIASGTLTFYPEPMSLSAVVKEAIDMVQLAADRARVVVYTEIEAGLEPLVLDRLRFKQVLSNYLSNAIKFSHAEGAVTVRARADGRECLCVEVEDTGIGISKPDQKRLFAEFHQIDSSSARQHPGTGLGLALARTLVEAQGGTVGVHSTLGKGSTFYFVLKRDTRLAKGVSQPLGRDLQPRRRAAQ